MGRISLKTAICAVFCAWGAIGLSGCVDPVDLGSFAEDEKVQEIIEKGAGTVSISPDSEPNLEAGNRKITGLDPGKYYMVEEWNQNGIPVGVQFVSASGGRTANLTNIGVPSGGEITGLTNSYHYKVKVAVPLSGSVPYDDLSTSASGAEPITDGAVTLPGPADASTIVYALSPPLSLASYDIVEIPISPAGSARPALRTSGSAIITLLGKETVNDYVFFESTSNFYVLRVASDQVSGPVTPGNPGEIVINVTLSYTGDNPPQLPAAASINYPQSDNTTVPINVTNAAQYDVITWYIDGTEVGTGSPFNLNKGLSQYKIIGVYTITVVGRRGGIPYSAAIVVTVSP